MTDSLEEQLKAVEKKISIAPDQTKYLIAWNEYGQ